jgi:hypothetical protein
MKWRRKNCVKALFIEVPEKWLVMYIFLTENMAKKNKINCDAILINRLIN